MPEGESLRQAVRWISERRRDDPKVKLSQVIDEASKRFDLSPVEADFLLRELTSNAPK
jgi:hypothetical protein